MQTEEILWRFALLAGLTTEQAQPYRPLVELAQAEAQGRLRPGTDITANAQRLTMLCAANACLRYVLLLNAQGGGAVTLGDISVNANPRAEVQSAQMLLQEYTAAFADILTDDGFMFGTVSL